GRRKAGSFVAPCRSGWRRGDRHPVAVSYTTRDPTVRRHPRWSHVSVVLCAPRSAAGRSTGTSFGRLTGAADPGGTVASQPVPAEQVLLDQMVPAAAPAHLDNVDLELAVGHRQDRQLGFGPGLSGGLLEL